MNSSDFLSRLQRHTTALVQLALDDRIDRQAHVPSCPGWRIDDLFGHLWAVEHWVRRIIRTRDAAPESDPGDAGVRDFIDSLPDFLTVLRNADPDDACWTFGPEPHTIGFWHRRQAHEHAIHHWDIANAVGQRIDFDPTFAADGVSEIVDMFYPRQVRLGRTTLVETPVRLIAADTGAEWLLGQGDPTTTLTSTASDLYLGLWKRIPLAVGNPTAAVALSARLTP